MHSLKYLFVLLLYCNTLIAKDQAMHDIQVNDLETENKQLSQKFRMASYLLTHTPLKDRIKSSDNKDATELFKLAQSNFILVRKKINEKNWLEANAIIDSVLRDLTSASQLLNKGNMSRNKYKENLKRVKSFVLPDWSDLSVDEQTYLDKKTKEISGLMNNSKNLADEKEYARASHLLDEVYAIKTQLLKVLKHESTIVYDQLFDTQEEEFDYMLKRSQHYLGLVESVLKDHSFNPQTRKLIDTYVQQGKLGISKARELEKDKQHEQAIVILDKSIKNLSSSLKIMGIKL